MAKAAAVAVGVIVAIIVIGAVVAYHYRHGSTGTTTTPATTPMATRTSTTSSTPPATTSQPATGTPTTAMPSVPSQGFQVNNKVAAACKNIGNGLPIGQNIKWLFDHHSEFHFVLHEYPSNKTIVWIITAPNKEALEILKTHIEQMECVIEHGGNPRPFDPLFKVDAIISSKYVHTEIKWLNNTAIEVIKKADNDCAWLVIKLHAQVVKGFFTTGRLEAQKIHEIPPDAAKICEPYLNTTTTS